MDEPPASQAHSIGIAKYPAPENFVDDRFAWNCCCGEGASRYRTRPDAEAGAREHVVSEVVAASLRSFTLRNEASHLPEVGENPADRDDEMNAVTSRRVVLFDIDGTLALRGDRGPFDWDRVGEDRPNLAVVELAHTIAAAGLHRIVVMSGRDEVCRWQTEMWLAAHGITYDGLHMRPHKDNRKDSILKRELFEQHVAGRYEVAFVVDDRDQVVKEWRSMGLTCFQVAEGAF